MGGSLHDLPSYVADAFVRVPVVPFQPENTLLGVYTFLPWVRTGIAQAVHATPNETRADVDIAVTVTGDGASQTVSKQLLVRGPGDVLDFSGRQIVRRCPQPGATQAEDSFLAHVEFDRPDFPWIFTPAAPAGDRLSPWIALVVLRVARANLEPPSGGLPARVTTTLSELQPLDDSWAWAHAQIVGPEDGGAEQPSVDDRLTPAYSAQNLSRLLCPRRPAPNESYVACVVPAYDAGVKAGLGAAEDGTLEPAWTRAPDGSDRDTQITLPVYDSWQFGTGPAGDFKALAEKLEGLPAPWQVGRRVVDVANPGGELSALAPADSGRLQTTRGPVVSPQEPSAASADLDEVAAAAAENAAWPTTETEALRTLLNQPDRVAMSVGELGDADIPLVGPEIYARYHAGFNHVSSDRDDDWFGELNLRPTDRVTAGLGTRVVQRDQDRLMQSAWAQVGHIDDANQQLRRAQLARFVGASWHARHLAALKTGPLLQVTAAVHPRVRVDDSRTVHATIRVSTLAQSATSSAFRRATRSAGALGRVNNGSTVLDGLLERDGALRDFRREYADLDCVAGVSETAARVVDPAIVSAVMDLGDGDATTARNALLEHGAKIAAATALSEALTPEAVADARPDPALRLEERAGALLLNIIGEGVSDDDRGQGRVVSTVSLLNGLTRVGGPIGQVAGEISGGLMTNAPIKYRPVGLPPLGGPVVLPPVIGRPRPPVEPPPPVIGHPPPVGGPPVVHPPPVALPPGAGPPVLGPPIVRPPLFDRSAASARVAPARAAHPLEADVPPNQRLIDVLHASAVAPTDAATRLRPVADALVAPTWSGTPARPALELTTPDLLASIEPARTLTARIRQRIGVAPEWLPDDWFDDGQLQPVMAAPVFTRPMYQALDAYDREWLVPGLATLPVPDLVTLLRSNARFIEAFLVGLSHEMGRELLWRGFPTDQRGTYFRRFWNRDADELPQDIHQFGPTELSTHVVATLSGTVVLLVRGELIRRFPSALVMALRNDSAADGPPEFLEPVPGLDPPAIAPILFHGHLEPDMVLVGFDLLVDDVVPQRWWFVIAEHPTAPRFGLSESRAADLDRDTLAWTDLLRLGNAGTLGFLTADAPLAIPEPGGAGLSMWGSEAATTAHILLRDPVRAAFDGADLLGPTGNLP